MLVLFAVFVVAGSVASLQTGLTWDEGIEQQTFNVNRAAADGLLHGDLASARAIHSYRDRYYGVGFHALAYPFQVALQPYVERTSGLDASTSLLLAKHPAAFLAFALSVLIFYKFLRLFVRERLVAALFAAAYAIYPYLFGHGMMNVKDIPYMSAWLLCTYLSVRLVRHHLANRASALLADGVALLLATTLLVSIRMPGLLIVLQYLVTFVLADRASKEASPPRGELLRLPTALAFLLPLAVLVIAVYPILWLDTLYGLFGAFDFMRRHPWNGCTLTWGQCMPAQDLPMTYLPGWLVVKLPLLVLIGLTLLPFAYTRIAREPLAKVAFLTLVFGSLYLVVFAIVAHTPLYDESRQFLFVYPLLFLLACIALNAASRTWSLAAASLSLALFAWDHAQLHPYQYVYFNEGARFLSLNRMFETDFWSESGREMGGLINANPQITRGTECIFAQPYDHYRPFIDARLCVKDFEAYNRQPATGSYVVVAYTRSRFTRPAGCRLAAEVFRTFPLSGEKATMAVVHRCDNG